MLLVKFFNHDLAMHMANSRQYSSKQGATDPRTTGARSTAGLEQRQDVSIFEYIRLERAFSKPGKLTIRGLVGLVIVSRRLHITTAERVLHHAGVIVRELARHIDLLRGRLDS